MRLEVSQPILTNEDLERIRTIGKVSENPFRTATIDITYDVANGPEYMEAALDSVCGLAERAVKDGYNIIILSDRAVSGERVPIAGPSRHLGHASLSDPQGACAPRWAWWLNRASPAKCTSSARWRAMARKRSTPISRLKRWKAWFPSWKKKSPPYEAVKRYIKAVDKGIMKVMSKMGISTYQSYCGAQIFDAIGLSTEFVDKYFTGTATQIEGVGLAEIAEEAFRRHEDAFGTNPVSEDLA